MIWYLILALITIGPFAIYFIGKAFNSSFDKSKNYYIDAELVKKTINHKEEMEKDIIFDETISSKEETTYTFEFLTNKSEILEFNVTEEDFNNVAKGSRGKLCYKKYLGIPTFMSFAIKTTKTIRLENNERKYK